MWPQFPCKDWVNDDRDNWGISVTARLVALNKFGKKYSLLVILLSLLCIWRLHYDGAFSFGVMAGV